MSELSGIVYLSTSRAPFDQEGLKALASQSAASNEAAGISGFLYYSKGRFVQYIEGERKSLLALYDKIAADERHTIEVRLVEGNTSARKFPGWSMRWIRPEELTTKNLEQLLMTLLERKSSDDEEAWKGKVWLVVDGVSSLYAKMALEGKETEQLSGGKHEEIPYPRVVEE